MQVAYGIATSTEVAYFTYIYAKISGEHYRLVCNWKRKTSSGDRCNMNYNEIYRLQVGQERPSSWVAFSPERSPKCWSVRAGPTTAAWTMSPLLWFPAPPVSPFSSPQSNLLSTFTDRSHRSLMTTVLRLNGHLEISNFHSRSQSYLSQSCWRKNHQLPGRTFLLPSDKSGHELASSYPSESMPLTSVSSTVTLLFGQL